MTNSFIKMLCVSLTCTIVIELLFVLLLKVRDKKDIINIILVNIMTNPVLVTLSMYINIFFGLSYRNILIYPMEIIVVLIEGLIYKRYLKYDKINSYLLSLILNSASYLIGLLINMVIY